jgi:hypothetical protein
MAGKLTDFHDVQHGLLPNFFSFVVRRNGLEPVHHRSAVFDGMRQHAQRSAASPTGLS